MPRLLEGMEEKALRMWEAGGLVLLESEFRYKLLAKAAELVPAAYEIVSHSMSQSRGNQITYSILLKKKEVY